MNDSSKQARYFSSYSGVKLPFKLVGELAKVEIVNRNTYFMGQFDNEEHLIRCLKIVYGETEFEHLYQYHDNGLLRQATITLDDETTQLFFDREGKPTN